MIFKLVSVGTRVVHQSNKRCGADTAIYLCLANSEDFCLCIALIYFVIWDSEFESAWKQKVLLLKYF